MLINIVVRVSGASGNAILQRILKLPFIPSIGMKLSLKVGNNAVRFPVEGIEWSEITDIFFLDSSWHTHTCNALVPFKEDTNWRVTLC